MNKFVLPFILVFSTQASAELVDKTVAIVNSEVILDSDLKKVESNLDKPGAIDETLLDGKSTASLKGNKKAILDYLIAEKILASEIKKQGFSVTQERANQEFKEIAKRNGMDESQLVTALKGQGIDAEEYKVFIKARIEKQSLLDGEIASKLRISDDEAFAEYQKGKPSAKGRVNEYTVAHIFFNPKKSGGAEKAAERAQDVLEKLKKGGKFETLAEQSSEDSDFTAGGLLGTFKTGELSAEFDQALSSLQVGQYSGLVPSKRGIHILKLNSKKEIPDPAFEKEKEKIKAKLLDAAFGKQFQSWLSRKKEEAFIRVNQLP